MSRGLEIHHLQPSVTAVTPAQPIQQALSTAVEKLDSSMKDLLLQEVKINLVDEEYLKLNTLKLMEKAKTIVEKEIIPLTINATVNQKLYRALLMRDYKSQITSWVAESKKGIDWPHPTEVREKLRLAGFEFAPTVLLRRRKITSVLMCRVDPVKCGAFNQQPDHCETALSYPKSFPPVRE